ncbi:SpoIIE family protein phosphatase [Dietzia sp. CH92]|uniref:PP2C family protein-serine/threonine phosphatase n=1 Tax=Dietzia sp. CH92 TaxID=3051823 RepID=UPI0028CFF687|nr:SpoIIE family protein phosphatase [Dietzia sp. CH92]
MTGHPWSIPADVEARRARDVDRLGLLDTVPEDRFDQVTRMARRVLGVPAASLSLMDEGRQWMKAIEGLDLTEVPREKTVCRTTIARAYRRPDDPALVIPDAAADPEFAEIPGIGGEGGIRFYAGYPLYGPSGHPVGTFCLYDFEPRHLDEDEFETFVELAEWAQRELERTDEIDKAAEIQRRMLPRPLEGPEGYRVSAVCLPAFTVGGDFYDHFLLGDTLGLTVADVMGKGLGAAIVASAVRASVRGSARYLLEARTEAGIPDTSEVVRMAAAHLEQDFEHTETFVTTLVATIDLGTGRINYVDAGHGLAMIRRADGRVDSLTGGGPPIGILPGTEWESATEELHPGDMLVICSDGLLDLLDEVSDRTALRHFVAAHECPSALTEAAHALAAGLPPLDDVTVVAVRREDA